MSVCGGGGPKVLQRGRGPEGACKSPRSSGLTQAGKLHGVSSEELNAAEVLEGASGDEVADRGPVTKVAWGTGHVLAGHSGGAIPDEPLGRHRGVAPTNTSRVLEGRAGGSSASCAGRESQREGFGIREVARRAGDVGAGDSRGAIPNISHWCQRGVAPQSTAVEFKTLARVFAHGARISPAGIRVVAQFSVTGDTLASQPRGAVSKVPLGCSSGIAAPNTSGELERGAWSAAVAGGFGREPQGVGKVSQSLVASDARALRSRGAVAHISHRRSGGVATGNTSREHEAAQMGIARRPRREER
eukprot:RCo041806